MKRVTLAAVCSVALSACFNFDDAYTKFCAGGRCSDGGTGGGSGGGAAGGNAGGGSVGGGSGTVGGGSGTVGGGSGTVGGGSGTTGGGGGATGGGTGGDAGFDGGVDAGCLGYGVPCTAEGQCCTQSDKGFPMACGRSNFCQEHAPDCREGLFTCTSDAQCCTGKCNNGRCKACGTGGATCTAATDCCTPDSCDTNGLCTSSAALGGSCRTAEGCASNYCARDGGTALGVCASPTGCAASGAAGVCCSGLEVNVAGTQCAEPKAVACGYDSTCSSSNCVGGFCADAGVSSRVPNGQRCTNANSYECGIDYCDPIGRICNNRWCIPAAAPGPWVGCCDITSTSCEFFDGGSCLLPGEETISAGACCSNAVYTSGGKVRCDSLIFY